MKITLNRPKQIADRVRSYKIRIDGDVVSEIKAGSSISIKIPDGASVIQANIDWGQSNELEISHLSPNDSLTVENSFSHKLWIPFIAIYYTIFAKKKYLKLSKDSQ